MLIPLSWLKDYVEIKLPLPDLMWRMTEVGLTTESFTKTGNEIILDVEVTANRPDWMSVIGVAREVAAIQKVNLKLPRVPEMPKLTLKPLPIKLKTNYKLIERWSGVILSDVEIKDSPKLIQDRLKLIGLRPINNIVDITNYVMFEYGIPMHAFDYDEIEGGVMNLMLSAGGEKFVSVDELEYTLPKNSMIIKDSNRIIDLIGIKGGLNSGISKTTKNILLHVTIDNPVLIRKTSQNLGLRSEASAIYERGPDKGGTLNSLKRAADLIIKYANAAPGSQIFDYKEKDYHPREIKLELNKLNKILGITIEEKDVLDILSRLNLSPDIKGSTVVCEIPTYRGDIGIEEDLVEEVARIWGYNNFPKTLPQGKVSDVKIPYHYDRSFETDLKNIMMASGYTEAVTLSLLSRDLINQSQLHLDSHIKIKNPVSTEYEYLRTTLMPYLLMAVKLNAHDEKLKLFEYAKTYTSMKYIPHEEYKLSAVEKNTDFRSIKGTVDLILDRLNIGDVSIKPSLVASGLWHPVKSGVIDKGNKMLGTFGEIHPEVLSNLKIKDKVYAMEFDAEVLKSLMKEKIYHNLSQYPAQIEDITIVVPDSVYLADVIKTISSSDQRIVRTDLKDIFKNSYTFRINYQDPTKTLENTEVEKIRNHFVRLLEKLNVKIKS